MYKNASANAQHRTTTAALFDTKAAGIDPTVWKDLEAKDLESQREILVGNKLKFQQQLSEVNARMTKAGTRAHEEGKFMPSGTWQQLVKQKQRLQRALQEIDELTRKLRVHCRESGLSLDVRTGAIIKKRERSPVENFYSAFYAQAQEMLAGPVFERIRLAAHHRTAAAQEMKDG
jgi:hypothetical protein